MDRPSGEPGGASALEILAALCTEGRTGSLEVRKGGEVLRLHLREGELYVPAAGSLGAAAGGGDGAAPGGVPERLAAALAGWSAGAFRPLTADAETPPVPFLGPISGAVLRMEAAVRGRSEEEMLASLGGEGAKFQAVPGALEAASGLHLEPREGFFLSRLEQPLTLRQLAEHLGFPRGEAIRQLCRLAAAGLVRRPGGGGTAAGVPSAVSSPELLEGFSGRVAASLAQRPLPLSAAEHRRRLLEILARSTAADHYRLLGLGPGASPDDVHRAYEEVARLVHPEHAAGLGLGDQGGRLEDLFGRCTEAYLILSDLERRKSYDRRLAGRGAAPGEVEGPDRPAERRRAARENFEAAASLAAAEDYSPAVDLLEHAVLLDPRPEYYGLLAKCQAKNPRWRREAMASLGKALELRPDDPSFHAALGGLYEREGDGEQAVAHYRAALRFRPGLEAARAGLERLGRSAAGRRGSWRSLWRRQRG